MISDINPKLSPEERKASLVKYNDSIKDLSENDLMEKAKLNKKTMIENRSKNASPYALYAMDQFKKTKDVQEQLDKQRRDWQVDRPMQPSSQNSNMYIQNSLNRMGGNSYSNSPSFEEAGSDRTDDYENMSQGDFINKYRIGGGGNRRQADLGGRGSMGGMRPY